MVLVMAFKQKAIVNVKNVEQYYALTPKGCRVLALQCGRWKQDCSGCARAWHRVLQDLKLARILPLVARVLSIEDVTNPCATTRVPRADLASWPPSLSVASVGVRAASVESRVGVRLCCSLFWASRAQGALSWTEASWGAKGGRKACCRLRWVLAPRKSLWPGSKIAQK